MRYPGLMISAFLVLATSAAAAEVKVEHDPKADFSRYKTWSWRNGTPAPNPFSDKKLKDGIESRLAAHGLKRVENGGDLEIVYHAAGENQISTEKLGYKVREAQLQKIPYVLVVGEREAQEKTVSVRKRGGEDAGALRLDGFLAAVKAEIQTRALASSIGSERR